MRRLRSIDRRLLQGLTAAWVLALLALPAVLWLLGDRQPMLESRAKVEFPALNRGTLGNEETFRRIDDALLDRLPGRGKALDLHAQIALDVFKDSTNPDVAIGDDGYLYYVPELAQCQPGGELTVDPADTVDVLARTLLAAGVSPTVTITGSKLLIHDADAPEIDADAERCADAIEQRVDERLRRTPGAMTITPELRAHEQAGEPTFLRKDTHWNWRGREIFARRVLDRLRPGLARQVGLAAGETVRRDADLLRILGRPGEEDDRAVEARRTPTDPLEPGSVVLIGDSQMKHVFVEPDVPGAQPTLAVALPGQVQCDWPTLVAGGCDDALRRARSVVIQKVARDMAYVSQQCWRPVALMGERLRGTPARWERVDGGTPTSAAQLTFPDSGSVRVRVRVRVDSADSSSTPRLLRLPIAHDPLGPDGRPVPVAMTQEPQAGPAAPCAMPSQIGDGGGLFLPVPAGRRVSDLIVRLQGAPGTRMAAPEEIVLDGRRAPALPAR